MMTIHQRIIFEALNKINQIFIEEFNTYRAIPLLSYVALTVSIIAVLLYKLVKYLEIKKELFSFSYT